MLFSRCELHWRLTLQLLHFTLRFEILNHSLGFSVRRFSFLIVVFWVSRLGKLFESLVAVLYEELTHLDVACVRVLLDPLELSHFSVFLPLDFIKSPFLLNLFISLLPLNSLGFPLFSLATVSSLPFVALQYPGLGLVQPHNVSDEPLLNLVGNHGCIVRFFRFIAFSLEFSYGQSDLLLLVLELLDLQLLVLLCFFDLLAH